MTENHWKICSACKKPIGFSTKYYLCNVSTCNQKRTGWVFCKVECWDSHVPTMRHKESWAEEKLSPTPKQWEMELAGLSTKSKPERVKPAEAKPFVPKVIVRRAK